MNHELFQQHISQLIDNELSESLEQDLFIHLGSCKECRNFLKTSWQMQSDIQIGKPRVQAGLVSIKDSAGLRTLRDNPPIAMEFSRKGARAPIRTLALAIFVVVLGCVMFSTTISVAPPIPSRAVATAQNSENAAYR